MTGAVIGLGSNLGDGRANLQAAWQRLVKRVGRPVALSSPYLTAPVDMASSLLFTNAVGLLETALPPERLLAVMLELEREMGRDRRNGRDRIIDLDLLFYDELVIKSAALVLPHPHLARRAFVLVPLAEILPDRVHPLAGLTVAAMLDKLGDPAGVTKIDWERS